ncbi:hypothetical protein O7635_32230 [Asanoa sp. WMMD1127]|uniref:hypothetical protein n=1 Tax=Asanoa sp. WMMD1127 TaxID=3016107 RepID=UPI002416FA08|nr:hypothetical protein [Asanoa sp. WMMD1127]MDG4826543.1 hypothetical protein [Asanoa sp. WMMD1127]
MRVGVPLASLVMLASAALAASGLVGRAVPAAAADRAAAREAPADATVFAPKSVPGRKTTIDVWCGARATSASVNVTPFGGPPELPLAPHPAGGPGAFRVAYQIPADAAPGSYDVVAECDDGRAGDATLVVGVAAAAQPAESGGGRTALALLSALGIVTAVAGGGFALARRFGPRSRLRT